MTQLADKERIGSAAPDRSPDTPPDTPQVRLLKFVVIGLGVLILVGLATVIGRIIYLASNAPRQVSVSASARLAPNVRLSLPPQAIVRHVSLSGDRLLVSYDSPAGSGISIVDVATGAVLSRIDIVPEVPR